MIPVSNEYKRQLIAGNRDYQIKLGVVLSNGQNFILTNEEIWDNGITINEAISSDSSFDIGAAIVSSLQVVINNIDGQFSEYDFLNARLTLEFGVTGDLNAGQQRYYRKGFYVVDEPAYNGSLITLNCLDNMTWFDAPFSEVGVTPTQTTAGNLVNRICSYCGVQLATVSFPDSDRVIYAESIEEILSKDVNCREVIQYVAQKCCCYCKINTAGQLVLKWYNKNDIINFYDYDGGTYDTHTTPYSDGVELEGGRWYWDGATYVWTQGDEVDGGSFQELQNAVWISQNYEINVSTDDIVITGVRVCSSFGGDDEKYDILVVDSEIERTHDRYVLVIENNPLIIKAEAQNIANAIAYKLAGLPIRAFNSRSVNDLSYETGDMATIVDFRGNVYHTWLTNFTFTTNEAEAFGCGAESVKKRNETRYSSTIRTLAEIEETAKSQITDYDRAVKAMDELAQNAIGYSEYYYPTEATALDSRVTYRYNGSSIDTTDPSRPKFPNSSVVFKISGDGVFVSTTKDEQGYQIYTNGYDANSGTAILNLIYSIGLNAQWIKAGQIDADRLTANVIQSINSATGSTVISGGKLSISGIIGGINGNGNTTTIEGGKIRTGSMDADRIGAGNISADRIKANVISAVNLSSDNISADRIKANVISAVNSSGTGTINANKVNVSGIVSVINSGSTTTIDGGRITANTITSSQISVSKLDAISAKLGSVSVGGDGNVNGALYVKDSNGNNKVTLNNSGISVNGGVFSVNTNGKVTATNAEIYGTITANKGGTIGAWTICENTDTGTVGRGALTFNTQQMFLAPNGSRTAYTMADLFQNKQLFVKFGNAFAIDTVNNVYVKGRISASSGYIGSSSQGWEIDTAGLKFTTSVGSQTTTSWVKPTEISCGAHGATLVKMIGSTSNHNGYLSVEVNSSDDYIHVKYNSIIKKNNGNEVYATWNDGSDERIKKEIEDLTYEEALTIIKNTEPLTFRYKQGNQVKHYGFVAQRIEKECEDLDLENPFVRYGEMEGDLKNVDYTQFIAPLMKVVQHQQEEIDLLKQELAELKARAN